MVDFPEGERTSRQNDSMEHGQCFAPEWICVLHSVGDDLVIQRVHMHASNVHTPCGNRSVYKLYDLCGSRRFPWIRDHATPDGGSVDEKTVHPINKRGELVSAPSVDTRELLPKEGRNVVVRVVAVDGLETIYTVDGEGASELANSVVRSTRDENFEPSRPSLRSTCSENKVLQKYAPSSFSTSSRASKTMKKVGSPIADFFAAMFHGSIRSFAN